MMDLSGHNHIVSPEASVIWGECQIIRFFSFRVLINIVTVTDFFAGHVIITPSS
jgi:hypothetical protein